MVCAGTSSADHGIYQCPHEATRPWTNQNRTGRKSTQQALKLAVEDPDGHRIWAQDKLAQPPFIFHYCAVLTLIYGYMAEPGIILSLHLVRSALKNRTETRSRLTRTDVRS